MDWSMLIWITQLGLSVALPLTGFTMLGVWLQKRYALGKWVMIVFLFLGLIAAAAQFIKTLHEMERSARKRPKRSRESDPGKTE